MEEEPSEAGELPEAPREAEGDDGATTRAPFEEEPGGAAAQALAMEAEEIRRLVEAGAGSPEAIRELAARLREHRAREEALWRAEVKPALVKEGKGRFRGHSKPAVEARPPRGANMMWLGAAVLGLVLVVLIAANTTVWVLIVPVLALLVWAWQQGRDTTP